MPTYLHGRARSERIERPWAWRTVAVSSVSPGRHQAQASTLIRHGLFPRKGGAGISGKTQAERRPIRPVELRANPLLRMAVKRRSSRPSALLLHASLRLSGADSAELTFTLRGSARSLQFAGFARASFSSDKLLLFFFTFDLRKPSRSLVVFGGHRADFLVTIASPILSICTCRSVR